MIVSVHSGVPVVRATLGGGMATVASRSAPLSVTSDDWVTGMANVREMKVWGDIDPSYMPERYAAIEGDASWHRFSATTSIVLTAGAGAKTISVKVRNISGVESEAVECTTALACSPHLSVLWSSAPPAVEATGDVQFLLSSSHDCDDSALVLSPTDDAEFEDCTLLVTVGALVAGVGTFVTLPVADMLAVDPAPSRSGARLVRPFVSAGGRWYGDLPFRWG